MRYLIILVIVLIGLRVEYATHQKVDQLEKQVATMQGGMERINSLIPPRYLLAIECNRCHYNRRK